MSITSEKNILVVDNNPVIVKLMTELLKGKGHHVRSAADVFTCLDILSDWIPDIIYLDLIMPRIGGDDLCRIIRGRAELKHCYLVIVSGAVLEQAADFLDFGADEYIAKGPFKEMTVHIMQAIENSVKRPVGHTKQIKGGGELRPRQVTRELLEQNHHFKITLDSISQGIVEIELGRVVFVNSQALRLLGIQKRICLAVITRIHCQLQFRML